MVFLRRTGVRSLSDGGEQLAYDDAHMEVVMHRAYRIAIGTLLVAAFALGVAGLMAPPVPAAPGGGQFCGGILGVPCPEGFVCKDDPRDDCRPTAGGADCPGICRRG
jgi:hypothetical protein